MEPEKNQDRAARRCDQQSTGPEPGDKRRGGLLKLLPPTSQHIGGPGTGSGPGSGQVCGSRTWVYTKNGPNKHTETPLKTWSW